MGGYALWPGATMCSGASTDLRAHAMRPNGSARLERDGWSWRVVWQYGSSELACLQGRLVCAATTKVINPVTKDQHTSRLMTSIGARIS